MTVNQVEQTWFSTRSTNEMISSVKSTRITDEEYKLTLREGSRPFISYERPIAFAFRSLVEEKIRDLVSTVTLIPCEEADWVSPIVVIKKSNGYLRVCGDFRKLNTHLVDDEFPMQMIEELLAEIGAGNRFFAKIDLEAAYHQIPLAEECRPLTTIVTHIGTFQYTVIPFGLKTAPSCFQVIIQRLLKACRETLVYQKT